MGAGAAGYAMDAPRPLLLLLLLLLLGVSASRRGARALSPDGYPNGLRFRQGNTERSDCGGGSQIPGVEGRRGAPMPGSAEGRIAQRRP